jgi:hypothetical protein
MSALRDFAAKALESNRIGFGDLRRLQRDVLPHRITTTEEAELLLTIDGALARADRDWTDYLTDAVGQFAFWGMGPAGRIDQAKGEWLLAALAAARAKTAAAIVRDLVREAPRVDVSLGRATAGSRKASQAIQRADSPTEIGLLPNLDPQIGCILAIQTAENLGFSHRRSA